MRTRGFVPTRLLVVGAVFSLLVVVTLGAVNITSFSDGNRFSDILQSARNGLAAVITGSKSGSVPVLKNSNDVSSTASLKRGDVIISPRFYRSSWSEVAEAFGATRVGWTYGGTRLVSEAIVRGIPVQCAVPYWPPPTDPNWSKMICLTSKGKPADNFFHTATVIYPDVNSTAWRTHVLGEMKTLVDAGCTSFQQDEPTLNLYMAVHSDGCYSEESVNGFREYLRSTYSKKRLKALGVTDIKNFDYRVTHLKSLEPMFVEYQRQSVSAYHTWLHDAIESYALTRGAGTVTWSGNIPVNTGDTDNSWVFPSFDYLMSEIPKTGSVSLIDKLRQFSSITNREFKSPSAVTFPFSDIATNKHAIASAYALGLLPIIPWDVYTGPKTPRFFGSTADFDNLYELVRNHPEVFNNYTNVVDYYGTFPDSIYLTSSATAEDTDAGRIEKIDSVPATVDSVDMTASPDRIAVLWSGRYNQRSVPQGLEVSIRGVNYTTVSSSTVGILYLPKTTVVAAGDSIRVGSGTTSAARLSVTWSGRAALRAVPVGQKVVIAGKSYNTIHASTVGILHLPGDAQIKVGDSVRIVSDARSTAMVPYLISVRAHISNPLQKAVHIVNWSETDALAKLYVRRSDFQTPPSNLLTVENPLQASAITPVTEGEYYVYSLPATGGWAILY